MDSQDSQPNPSGHRLPSLQPSGDRPAIREKKFGIWQPTSWRQWQQISKDIAYALHAVGFRPGDVASILANAVPEWVSADRGILCAGGVSPSIYPTDYAAQVDALDNIPVERRQRLAGIVRRERAALAT